MTNRTNLEPHNTIPKPFVFVLIPFNPSFDDIYKFGIKGAAEDVGAYAERVDEQIFMEGILDRIFNQISKADVIVADMTGRNPKCESPSPHRFSLFHPHLRPDLFNS